MERKKKKLNDGSSLVTLKEIFESQVHTRVRIRWTTARERTLVQMFKESDPSKLGYLRRLTTEWNRVFPDLRTTETALSQRLYVMRNRENEPSAMVPEEPNSDIEEDPEELVVSNNGLVR